MAGTRVIVMRHAQSEANVTEIWTSARLGYPLTERGVAQARTAAAALRDRGVVAVYGSPLVRAQQTAREVADVLGLGLEHRVLEGMEEIHVGVHEGGLDAEVTPVALEVFRRWWVDGDLSHRFHGGESGQEIADRVARALGEVAAAHAGQTTVVVSHGGAMAVGITELCAGLDPGFVAEHLLANCATVELGHDPGGWRCLSWAGVAVAGTLDGDDGTDRHVQA